jgi:DNA invertase Pin-like site-specific DNA recombinase
MAAARARGRNGGRPYKMTAAKLRLAMASMGQKETRVGDLCAELGITRQTLYRHVSPDGSLRPDGTKLLGSGKPTTAKSS